MQHIVILLVKPYIAHIRQGQSLITVKLLHIPSRKPIKGQRRVGKQMIVDQFMKTMNVY